jgi:hypothetical protein
MHQLIDDIQLRIHGVHERLASNYFPTPVASGLQRMTAQSQTQSQSQRQTSLFEPARASN